MSVPAEVSLAEIESQLKTAADFSAAVGIEMDASMLTVNNLIFYVRFLNKRKEPFYTEFNCKDFPLYPPTIEFVDAARKQRGLASLYPSGFHSTPCICMRYNRKAYNEMGGPHGDWRLIDWQLATPNGGALDSLAMIISDLHAKISSSEGRLGR